MPPQADLLQRKDVVKTRLQTQDVTTAHPSIPSGEQSALLRTTAPQRLGALQIARQSYTNEGASVFFRGLGIWSIRAFFVNAIQWAVYEWMMHVLLPPASR